ncbi:Inner nuclear membrane protein Man1 like protein [Argiope bruennichi]|uniref:Inner nuclear membrane protein Man1 like protein n=1 Tax=Argiope bruennichi TaxID=94029 RepID=A0A8T0FJL7_ARGBR|nr:Inner nuclear membrane protein Man1 like protein [Argiope bruennichi]
MEMGGKMYEKLSLIRPREINSSPDSDIFKKPAAIPIPVLSQEKRSHSYHRTTQNSNRKGKKDSSKSSSYDIETSDSDLDAAAESSFSKSPRLRRKPLGSNFSTDLHGIGLRRTDDASTSYSSIFQRKSLNASWTPEPDKNFHRFSPTLDRLKREHTSPAYQSNGYLSSTISNGDFPEEKTVQGSSTNYSHCVSWFLLLGAIAFFVTIGLVYMTEVQKTTLSANKNYSKFCIEVNEDQCKSLILMSRELHYLLTTVAGNFECGYAKSRNLTVQEARVIMRDLLSADSSFKMEDFDTVFNHSLSLFKNNPKWGVKCLSLSEEISALARHSQIDYISALEATQAAKSLWCRIRLSIASTVTKILIMLAIGLLLFLMFLFVKYWKKRREAQEKLFYEMVERVIDILRDSGDSSQIDSLSGSCKAVVNVRDALIPPKDRKAKLWLWDRVVSFIEENESRVSVEYQKINGEDFKVWRWNPSTTTENEGTKQGKVWQGQAFCSLGKGKNAYTPTPCLKIRNMFEPEVEYGDAWKVSIRDAILEKCEGNNGIVHIAFDTTTNNEGCVFMLCKSLEAAGKAYNDLHGWWFDGKLVTVKYLKLSRYLERFPEADQCTEPLKPSNNKRLSMSTPFFSSALERS